MSDLQIFRSINEWQQVRRNFDPRSSVGFVPTMGALHAGHQSLIKRSASENDFTLVSIFVNPTQFNAATDLEHYPRTLEADLNLLRQAGAQAALLPTFEELYRDNYAYQISETRESETELCGKSRPGHFKGVLTVVMKLLNLARARRAYFGEKDFQQLQLIRGMAAAFFLPTEIIGCPTLRNDHGLALSSRNARLSPEGLRLAEKFAATLAKPIGLGDIQRLLVEQEHQGHLSIDYLEERYGRRFAAVVIEGVRLIDNVPSPIRQEAVSL